MICTLISLVSNSYNKGWIVGPYAHGNKLSNIFDTL